MMKKHLRMLLTAMVLLLLICGAASAETAPDLTASCTFAASAKGKLFRLTDGKLKTPYEGAKGKDTWITVTAPEGEYIAALYLVWPSNPSAVDLELWDETAGEWTLYTQVGARGFSHETVRIPPSATLRLHAPEDTHLLPLCELQAFGEGELPDTVQDWQPTAEKADMLLVVAHPDDEYIFFGGLLPTYAAARGLHVAVCYMTYGNETRLHELLNGLWVAGVREYPILLGYKDRWSGKLKGAYELWAEDDVLDKLAAVIDGCRPEVVVTHDVDGEYGHGAHMLCADVCLKLIAEGKRALTWTPKKLYIHLWAENQMMMDWETPLEELGDKTALEVAKTAFACHKSQQGYDAPVGKGKYYKFDVNSHDMFDNALYGLAFTTVGADEAGNDMMEHIGT